MEGTVSKKSQTALMMSCRDCTSSFRSIEPLKPEEESPFMSPKLIVAPDRIVT